MSVTYPPIPDWTRAIITGQLDDRWTRRLCVVGAQRAGDHYVYEAFTKDERHDFIQAFLGNQYLDVKYEKGPGLNTHADPDSSEGEGDPIVVRPSRLDPECHDLRPGQVRAYPKDRRK